MAFVLEPAKYQEHGPYWCTGLNSAHNLNEQKMNSLLEPLEKKCSPADNLILAQRLLDFWPLKLQDNTFIYFKLQSLWWFWYDSNKKTDTSPFIRRQESTLNSPCKSHPIQIQPIFWSPPPSHLFQELISVLYPTVISLLSQFVISITPLSNMFT